MEWSCGKCGLAATADDRGLLLAMGWRVLAGEMRCVICVKKEPERFSAEGRVLDLDGARERRERRELS